MTSIHAGNTAHTPAKGQCRWQYQFSGVWLYCADRALPLGALCADCLLAWAAVQPAAYWIAKDRIDGVKAS